MPLDRSHIRKGLFLTGAPCDGGFAPPCQLFKEQQAQAPSLAAIGERIAAAQKKMDELRRVIQAGKK